MEELHVMDVRMRGCAFTLYPAADEAGVSGGVMNDILFVIHRKAGTVNDQGISCEKEDEIEKQNPNMPTNFLITDLNEEVMQKAVGEGLIAIEGDKCSLTEKCMTILRSAAAKQRELDDKGFYFCPCAMH